MMSDKDIRRRFTPAQRRALFWTSGGQCENCGTPLDPKDWHADHINPHSYGGLTEIPNGQALCPQCNLSKGASIDMAGFKPWPENVGLRKWQEEFLVAYKDRVTAGEPNFLLVATPGAGKTRAMLRAASAMFTSGVVKQVVIVCPSDALREQWINKAYEVGISVTDFEESPSGYVGITADFIGLVTTYQQVAARYHHFLAYVSKRPTIVILDEIHHCGEQKSWGKAIEYAFSPAHLPIFRLSGSGTPFRSDNSYIPFVEYDDDYAPLPDGTLERVRFARADYKYLYRDALIDGRVVRDVAFVSFGGEFLWKSTKTGQEERVGFDDEIDAELEKERLRVAVNPQGEWLKDYIGRANSQLDQIRNHNGHRDAGGLVLAEESGSAEQIAKILQETTGEKPALVLHNIPDARNVIKAFDKSDQKWIVAVRMISEGVDIPRLRVLVWATTWRTKLFFQQAVGRVIRWQDDVPLMVDGKPTTQTALVYLPADPELMRFAEEMNQDIREWIKIAQKRGGGGEKVEYQQMTLDDALKTFEWLASQGLVEGDHILSSIEAHRMAPDLVEEALRAFASLPMFKHHLPTELAAAYTIIKGHSATRDSRTDDKTPASDAMVGEAYATIVASQSTGTKKKNETSRTQRDLRKYLRNGCHKMTNKLIFEMVKRGIVPGGVDTRGRVNPKLLSEMNKRIVYKLNRRQGVNSVTELLIEALQERQKLLADWIAFVIKEGRDPGVL
jgi:superfamily II DNA or RNA helicase